MTRWRLEVDQGDCGICDLCALACSNEKFGIMNPNMSAIRVNHRGIGTVGREKGGPGVLICWHCENPPCYPACKYNAMSIDENNVVSLYISDAPEGYANCITCMKCVKACDEMHMEASIFISLVKDNIKYSKSGRELKRYTLYKCDLCNGDPVCVKICPRNAIKFIQK